MLRHLWLAAAGDSCTSGDSSVDESARHATLWVGGRVGEVVVLSYRGVDFSASHFVLPSHAYLPCFLPHIFVVYSPTHPDVALEKQRAEIARRSLWFSSPERTYKRGKHLLFFFRGVHATQPAGSDLLKRTAPCQAICTERYALPESRTKCCHYKAKPLSLGLQIRVTAALFFIVLRVYRVSGSNYVS